MKVTGSLPDPLTNYKSRKFSYEFDEASRHFKEISPNPHTFFSEKAAFWYWVYQVDNCLSDLFSMWEGLIEEVARWLLGRGAITDAQYASRANGNESIVQALEQAGKPDLRTKMDLFYKSEVEVIRGARNGITHREFPLNVAIQPGVEIDLQLKDPKTGKTFNFFRDALAHYGKLRPFIIETRRKLGLPLHEDTM